MQMKKLALLAMLLTACTKGGPAAPALTPDQKFAEMLQGIESEAMRKEISYGKDLMDRTAYYIGPKGTVGKITGNLLSCKNCHLDSGARPFALPFFDSHGLYPQYRSREGKILTLADRINSCIKMPLQGTKLDEKSREMQALLLYIRYLGADRKVLTKDDDGRLVKIEYPNRAASPEKGRPLYAQHCARCHQENGLGTLNATGDGYVYPPLWGQGSYRNGSSMSRITIFARFIKANMPFDQATHLKPVLTDEEALDIAAFVNSDNLNPRPEAPKEIYPNPALKPFDAQFGPFADPFPPDQHKYGPFPPILNYRQGSQPHLRQLTDGDLNSP
jgi:thiosulfate dehydrogenase